ncbi:PREDICTED: probable RNA-binding protein EIF1AD [Amphimedon queenslandica]|uniref:Probable RNA-binding protein EIF1AD n=1 Tax=Amphimedon queenslandica TaxID=400682 RepID=A0A1X7VBK6_AMPQE|nr:PREDICTED: probable RNA-binding protein EIF1AD [Amphimedon queenslandica]|eukprot:XP_003385062.1 PREDICTED: probable RNA-binding protein EIF1AD [Amphimedon queenslandica]
MSKATKRKHVTKEVLEELVEPEGDQFIVKIQGGRGNNLHEAESPDGQKFLVSMPTKFRRNVWIKRGDFVIVDPIAEGNKVQAEIAHILYPLQIKNLKKNGLWPSHFTDKGTSPVCTGLDNPRERSDLETNTSPAASDSNDEEEVTEEDDDIFVNTNRVHAATHRNTSSSSSDENGG